MAEYKALKTFTGKVVMATGEVKEITDPVAVKDLLRAGYIEEVKKPAAPKKVQKKSE